MSRTYQLSANRLHRVRMRRREPAHSHRVLQSNGRQNGASPSSPTMHPRYDVIHVDDTDSRLAALVSALSSDFMHQTCVPILGAGVSVGAPSRLPLATDLMRALRRVLWASILDFARARTGRHLGRKAARQILREARLERMLFALQETHGSEPIHQFLSVLNISEWNACHAALGALAASGRLRCCVTLNFDLLIEYAIAAHGAASWTSCPLQDNAGFLFPEEAGRPTTHIVKPHGSLLPPLRDQSPFSLLAPTLAEIGNHVDRRNRDALERAIPNGSSILVAGYSDHDWDIFPILMSLAPRLSHIYWVQYLSPAEVRERLIPSDQSFDRIHSWLDSCGTAATLVLGDASLLLARCCDTTGTHLQIPEVSPKGSRVRVAPSSQFLSSERARTATAVAFALLLQDRGPFHQDIVNWLLTRDTVRADPMLHARVHRTAAHGCHTRRDLRQALRHMDQVLDLQRDATGAYGSISANPLVWKGYEHYCLTKRLGWRWALIAPVVLNLKRGRQSMIAGLGLSRQLSARSRNRQRALVRFYHGDLLHSWVGHTLFVGRAVTVLARPVFRCAANWYARAERIDPELMGWEYYWLRSLEARILAGDTIDDRGATLQRIDQIGKSYEMLQNHVQRGNALAYKALLSNADAERLLGEATEVWSAEDGFVPSGLLRVILFRRYLGLTSLFGALRDLWRLRRAIRANKRRMSSG